MSRWLLALLFAFGSVTFLTGCPAEDDADTDKPADTEDGDDDGGDEEGGDEEGGDEEGE